MRANRGFVMKDSFVCSCECGIDWATFTYVLPIGYVFTDDTPYRIQADMSNRIASMRLDIWEYDRVLGKLDIRVSFTRGGTDGEYEYSEGKMQDLAEYYGIIRQGLDDGEQHWLDAYLVPVEGSCLFRCKGHLPIRSVDSLCVFLRKKEYEEKYFSS